MEFQSYQVQKDFIIVGGGIPGICAAISAARCGLTVALINNRGYLGGNASAESYVSISGATGTQEFNLYARESGIIDEILLENLYRNPNGGRYVWDALLLDMVGREKNIELFQNTHVDRAYKKDNSTIDFCSGVQMTTEKRFNFYGRYFLDDTGDGTLGSLVGAEFRVGREARGEFSERLAPVEADKYTLPSTLNFAAQDTGRKVKYIAPDFALDLTKTDVLKYRTIPKNMFWQSHWFYEIGGDLDQITDNEEIIKKHRALVYGIWDYIKNSGEYDSENYDLTYVSCIPGKRESRRLVGDYILKEGDITEQRDFPDMVGYGGWSIDLHSLDGFFSKDIVNRHVFLNGIYQIPYRCGYSCNIDNLFMAGRCMSTSHVAFGSTRVMATLSTLAEALGAAAYLCKKHGTMPRGIYQNYLDELLQLVQSNDQYVVGRKYKRGIDYTASASSTMKCELPSGSDNIRLDKNMAIIVPVKKHIGSIFLKMKANKSNVLTYNVYIPTKKENYSPQNKVLSGNIMVDETQLWTELQINQDIDNNKVFIELIANNNIEITLADNMITGIDCLKKEPQGSPTVVEVSTLLPKEAEWHRIDKAFCFKLSNDEDIYISENINNGYSRPYGLPNLWLSDNKVEGESLMLEFTEEQMISKLDIMFNSNLNICLLNHAKYEFNALPDIVRDYDVYCMDGTKIKEVRGNYKRFNKLQFDEIKTKGIRLEFLSTNGTPHVGVYSINVY